MSVRGKAWICVNKNLYEKVKVSDICFQCSFSVLYISVFPAAIACVSVL